MLPTEDASCIAFHKLKEEEPGLFYSTKPSIEKAFDNQHLYFTTDEEIKKGDWYLLGNTPRQSTGDLGKPDTKWLKIIASTDPKLTTCKDGKDDKGFRTFELNIIPQPSQAFTKAYCEQGGIDEVDVEYETIHIQDYARTPNSSLPPIVELPTDILKVDSHNTITTHRIKDSWSKEEVIAACKEAFSCGVRLWEDWEEDDHKMWDNFVKENF